MSFEELKGILLEEKPSLSLIEKKDSLADLIPEFRSTYDFDQKTIWHTKDVFLHTMMVVDGVEKDLNLRIAALFHDIGKPHVMTIDENGGHFYGHWVVSEEIFQKYQDSFGLSEEDIYEIRKLIYYHDLTIRETNFDKFLEEFDFVSLHKLFALKESDSKGHNEIFVPDRLDKLYRIKRKLISYYLEKNHYSPIDTDYVELIIELCKRYGECFKIRGNRTFIISVGTFQEELPLPYWDLVPGHEIDFIPNHEKLFQKKEGM